jgi:hypothetical protein
MDDIVLKPNPAKPEPKMINHESTRRRKNEKSQEKFRVFSAVGGCFRDK